MDFVRERVEPIDRVMRRVECAIVDMSAVVAGAAR